MHTREGLSRADDLLCTCRYTRCAFHVTALLCRVPIGRSSTCGRIWVLLELGSPRDLPLGPAQDGRVKVTPVCLCAALIDLSRDMTPIVVGRDAAPKDSQTEVHRTACVTVDQEYMAQRSSPA